jgi:hypothetical protein
LAIILDIGNYYFINNENNGYIVHWTGYVIGLIISLILFPNILLKTYNKKLRIISIIFLILLSFILINNYIFYWPPKINNNCCYLLLTNQSQTCVNN